MIKKSDVNFSQILARIDQTKLKTRIENSTKLDVENAIKKASQEDLLSTNDLAAFLSPVAGDYLEEMAQISSKLTLKYFGKAIVLYQPIYISNYCENSCLYCGFSVENQISRKILTADEIHKEAKAISASGEVRHILLLTGEAPKRAGFDYILNAVEILKLYFSSVSIEVFPMDQAQYEQLEKAGVDGLTVYQETYNRKLYAILHPSGGKSDFDYRLEAPHRGAKAKLRSVSIGALYGLGDCRLDAFLSALHGRFLSDRFIDVEFSLSIPRMTDAAGGYKPNETMSDELFVQTLLAFRLFLPRLGINVSTRENSEFRNNLLGLGATRFSAGSKTAVGGYQEVNPSTNQFETGDNRSVEEVKSDLKAMGYQPVHKDWELIV